jgi:hypothetical protein
MRLIAIGLLALSTSAVMATESADFRFDTTEDLYEVCATPADAPEALPAALACRAFIEATVQYHDQVAGRKAMKRLVCYDETTTIEQARDAFLDWGKQHSRDKKLRAEQPVVGLMRALVVAYPCR